MAENVPQLGKLAPENAPRDAIHVAVIPVQCGQWIIQPGEHVRLEDGKATIDGGPFIGVADPFLTADIMPGQWFWLLMYPNTVKGLRHAWHHDAFAPKMITRPFPPMEPEPGSKEAVLSIEPQPEETQSDCEKCYICPECEGE